MVLSAPAGTPPPMATLLGLWLKVHRLPATRELAAEEFPGQRQPHAKAGAGPPSACLALPFWRSSAHSISGLHLYSNQGYTLSTSASLFRILDLSSLRLEVGVRAIQVEKPGSKGLVLGVLAITVRLLCFPHDLLSAKTNNSIQDEQEVLSTPQSATQNQNTPRPNLETAEDWNRRLKELLDSNPSAPAVSAGEYRIGPEDVLNINIFEAQELNREVRVSAGGDISLPLLGSVRAAGLTPRELEFVLQELLHRSYMKDPHVSVFVREMQSHPVSVMGAVRRPGVFQIRGSKTLLEVLSLAEGLADDAGETVIILRGAALSPEPDPATDHTAVADHPSSAAQNADEVRVASSEVNGSLSSAENAVRVNLKELLESADSRNNAMVHPGDIVKVT